jgi:hypothetical protein
LSARRRLTWQQINQNPRYIEKSSGDGERARELQRLNSGNGAAVELWHWRGGCEHTEKRTEEGGVSTTTGMAN